MQQRQKANHFYKDLLKVEQKKEKKMHKSFNKVTKSQKIY